MTSLAARRMPGIQFQPRTARLESALPRMDVAMFVGFAAMGPVHVPVAVEDAAQFRSIFGADLPLARDPVTGEVVQAVLAPAVRAFFAGGGRRCWVVRVASEEARYDHLPLPGLLAATASEDGGPSLRRPAFARARSPGSWADALRVATALHARPLQLAAAYRGSSIMLAIPDQTLPAEGDLLRITADNGRVVVFAQARKSRLRSREYRILLGKRFAFEAAQPPASPPGPTAVRARIFTYERKAPSPLGLLDGVRSIDRHPFTTKVPAIVDADPGSDGAGSQASWVLELFVRPSDAPAPGTWIYFTRNRTRWWLVVEKSGVGAERRGRRAVQVRGRAWRHVGVPRPFPTGAQSVERVSIDLRALQGADAGWTLSDQALSSAHPRCWNRLPVDDAFYRAESNRQSASAVSTDADIRFPLAGAEPGELVFLPLAVPAVFGTPVAPLAQSGSELERDGLAELRADLFLDTQLAAVSADQISGMADFIRYLSPRPRALTGIHTAMGWQDSAVLDEVTLIAVPDAVHRNWKVSPVAPLPPATASSRIRHPEWWHFLPCDPRPDIPVTEYPKYGQFQDEDIREIEAPGAPGLGESADATGTFSLVWSAPEPGVRFEVEESSFPDFSGARIVYSGPAQRLTLYGRSRGNYYFRVRAIVGRNSSHWSHALAVPVNAEAGARLDKLESYSDEILLAVQRALLRLCAARGDLFAVLSMPLHYREHEAIEHVNRLAGSPAPGLQPSQVPLLEAGELRALSYAALYHPWVVTRGPDGALREIPPDGAAAGVLAARAARRGAWIAPANELLPEALALAPMMLPENYEALQAAQINVLRREPRGFLCLSADTLSADPELRPINVRRLLMLLRRVALRRGAVYVFEPLSDGFRRSVQRGFEAMLFDLFERGAFAGRTPDTSYQVETGFPPNAARDIEQARFFVELKVAPSIPMRFLSVRLLNAGERLSVVEGG